MCLKKREMAQSMVTKVFQQPAKTAAMCRLCHEYVRPPPPILPFFGALKRILKRIAQTDNMQPKLYVEYTHHQWLKG